MVEEIKNDFCWIWQSRHDFCVFFSECSFIDMIVIA